MALLSFNYRCTECNQIDDRLVQSDEKDNEYACMGCGAKSLRTVSLPNIRTRNSRTYLDGQSDAQRKKDFKDLYDVNQAKARLYDAEDPKEVEELQVEILTKEGIKK